MSQTPAPPTRPRPAPQSVSGTTTLILSLLVLCVCTQDVTAHLGRIYKSARALDQSSNRSEGRKFPILRALVSQFISDRSSRDVTPTAAAAASKEAVDELASSHDPSTPVVGSTAAASQSKARLAEKPSKPTGSSNVKTIQHIIEDINSQNSKISSKRRKHFLVNILSRMLKSVNFTEVSVEPGG